jgi:hypothetical protein
VNASHYFLKKIQLFQKLAICKDILETLIFLLLYININILMYINNLYFLGET